MENELRILILAPTERDGPITSRLLNEAGIANELCQGMEEMAREAARGCGGVILAEEAITGEGLEIFLRLLQKQESWSDLPCLVITGSGELPGRKLQRMRLFGSAGNVTLLERPLRPITLVSAVEVALRARRRQYEQRDLLRQVREANEELEKRVQERTARLQETIMELEAFSYTVSHDLRAPLRTLHGFSELLMQEHGCKLEGEALDFLRRIAAGAERLDNLIEDVLALARIGREQMVLGPIELKNFLPALIREYPSLSEKAGCIEVLPELEGVIGHRGHLAQCLSNLLTNGLKFVAKGVTPRVKVWTERQGDRVTVLVKDNGIGMKQEHLKKIFLPFQRLHRNDEYEGSGMGLAIVKRAVERMGGEVGVASEAGCGSTFWIELRAAEPANETTRLEERGRIESPRRERTRELQESDN